MYTCECCSNLHDGSYGKGLKRNPKHGASRNRFCSLRCARAYSTKENRHEISKKVSDTMRRKAKPTSKSISVKQKIHSICKQCHAVIPKNRQFCSWVCSCEYKKSTYINEWKLGKKTGYIKGGSTAVAIRNYLFKKYQNKCCLCGWSEYNTKSNKVPLQVDHIDGNHKNNCESNLRLLCPNCHSLTPTYMGLNRGNGRKERYTK